MTISSKGSLTDKKMHLYCQKSRSMAGLLLIILLYALHFNMQKVIWRQLRQGSDGNLGKNLQEGSVHGPALELLGGMVDVHVLTA